MAWDNQFLTAAGHFDHRASITESSQATCNVAASPTEIKQHGGSWLVAQLGLQFPKKPFQLCNNFVILDVFVGVVAFARVPGKVVELPALFLGPVLQTSVVDQLVLVRANAEVGWPLRTARVVAVIHRLTPVRRRVPAQVRSGSFALAWPRAARPPA